jgi:hypothetical protein
MYLTGCPCCLYKRERYVKEFLESLHLSFNYHKKFTIPKTVIVDFFILDNNSIIEYNGEQHYMPIKRFGGKSKFLKQQVRDEQLRTYCKQNNIKLLELPYWLSDNEIKDKIKSFINK